MTASQVPAGSYASRLSYTVLRAHVTLGAIQIAVGCLVFFLNIYGFFSRDASVSTRTFSGIWTFAFFIPAGATGLAGGRGGSNAKCCLISCLVLSICAACVAGSALITNSVMAAKLGSHSYYPSYDWMQFTLADIFWFLAYLLEFVVAIVQAGFACRASCCVRGSYGSLNAPAGPATGAVYTGPATGAGYTGPATGAGYTGPATGAVYTGPATGAVYTGPATGAGYTGPATGAIFSPAVSAPPPPTYSSSDTGNPTAAGPSEPCKF